MNFKTQEEYAKHIRIIGEIFATEPERLMYIINNQLDKQIYFCFHLFDKEKLTVEYIIPTTIEELYKLKEKNISISTFIKDSLKENRLYRHIFRLDESLGYEIYKENNVFDSALPISKNKIREIHLFEKIKR